MSHLLNVTTFALDVRAITPLLSMFEEREKPDGVCYKALLRYFACTPTTTGLVASIATLPGGHQQSR